MGTALLIIITLIFAIQAIRARKLLASALWLAGVSAMLAILMYLMGAHLLAVVELSVGAGLVTVLFVFAINVAGEETQPAPARLPRPLAWVLAGAGVVLLGWLILPLSLAEAPPRQPPLSVLLGQQRGLDMLVQMVLIFSGVLGLLGILAETKAPLKQPVAEAVAAQRERDLLDMQQKASPHVSI
ncbi:MAG: hypothetical protein Kow0063_33290 [Anaerolineae bacterium]